VIKKLEYDLLFLAKMEEGFKLPLPKNVVLANSETAIGKVL
jgi:hypothetical protein